MGDHSGKHLHAVVRSLPFQSAFRFVRTDERSGKIRGMPVQVLVLPR